MMWALGVPCEGCSMSAPFFMRGSFVLITAAVSVMPSSTTDRNNQSCRSGSILDVDRCKTWPRYYQKPIAGFRDLLPLPAEFTLDKTVA